MRHQSSGDAGETAARYWFKWAGWHMDRHQPATRTIRAHGQLRTITVEAGGIPDYTGYETIEYNGLKMHLYRACEVKEARGSSMPCSRLGPKQRRYMDSLPNGCGWVGVLWVDHGVYEVFQYEPQGSYKKGEGVTWRE